MHQQLYQKFTVPGLHSLLYSITNSGETTSRYLFQHGKICENNYNL